MPAVSERQKNFMGAVMGAKKGLKNVGSKAKEVAKDMSESTIKDFLHKKGCHPAYIEGFMSKLSAFIK